MITRKRGAKWYYHFDWYDAEGNRHQVERAGTESKKETREIGLAAMAAIKAQAVPASAITCAALWEEWMRAMEKSGDLKEATIRKYRSTIRIYLTPPIGAVQLRKITPKMLQKILDDLQPSASHSTINTVASVLKRSMAWAVTMGEYLPASPAASIHVPKRREAAPETVTFSGEEIETILKHLEGKPLLLPVEIAIHTGMRIGEILALTWEDIDEKARLIHIHATITGEGQIQPIPKTKSSVRTIPYGQKLAEIIQKARIDKRKSRLSFGQWYQENDRICTREDGTPITPNNVRALNKWIKAHLKKGSIHTLRHTFATNLLENGADLELVSKHLGHSTITITAKYYSHVLDKRRNKLTRLMDEIL